jgi:hypothetical protein
MDSLEKTILKWLEARDPSWIWFFGREKLDKNITIEKFKKDKQFRKLIVEQVQKVAVEMFEQHLEKEKNASAPNRPKV